MKGTSLHVSATTHGVVVLDREAETTDADVQRWIRLEGERQQVLILLA